MKKKIKEKETISKVLKGIDDRIEYIKEFRSEKTDKFGNAFRNGWAGVESGPCCDKCKMDKEAVIKSGSAVGLRLMVGCTNPFQIKEQYGKKLCQCHIPYRKVVAKAQLHLLKSMAWNLCHEWDIHDRKTKYN